MLGMLDALRDGGIDLGEADLVVGTSAGALAGAPLARCRLRGACFSKQCAQAAVPGVFQSVTIDGRRYADGGLCSPYNTDLATGHRVVNY